MRVCVYGAGAIGGYLAVKLARSGNNVTVIARGENLDVIKRNGLTLLSNNIKETATVNAAADVPKERQDFVFLATKSTSLSQISENVKFLISKGATIVPLMNGIPHWYFFGIESRWRDRSIECLDPMYIISRALPWKSIIGSVVYPACELIEPGIIHHTYGNRFSIGEITGEKSKRISLLSNLLVEAGLKAPIRSNIRVEIWVKLLGNLPLNSISALTSATIKEILENPKTEQLTKQLMIETKLVAEALDIKIPISIENRLKGAHSVGDHKTSMLQDLENGRQMEINSIISAVQEFGKLTNTKTPKIDTVLAILKKRSSLINCFNEL